MRAFGRGRGRGDRRSAAMLQGALTAVAAKAKEAKAAVGSAVGEIRDALDNPTYDENEEDWSDEDQDAGIPESTGPTPRVNGSGATASDRTAAVPAGGALAALRARLAAERQRKKAAEHREDTSNAERNESESESASSSSSRPEPPGTTRATKSDTTNSLGVASMRERNGSDVVSPPTRSTQSSGNDSKSSSSIPGDANKPTRSEDAERFLVEAASARREDAVRHAAALRVAEHTAQLAQRDLETLKFELEKKEKELQKLRKHLLDSEAEYDEKETALKHLETDLQARAEGAVAEAVESAVTSARAAALDVEILRETLAKKDAEIVNLQLALEHFDDEQEDAERRVLELAALREKNAVLSAELAAERARVASAFEKAEEAERRCALAQKHAASADAAAQKSVLEASRARRALREQVDRTVSARMDSAEQIDRRVMGKLLVTYFEREQSLEVLELMVRVLGLGAEDRAKIGVGRKKMEPRGVLRTVAAAPGRIVLGALGVAKSVAKAPVAVAETYKRETDRQTVADQWVDFLLQQMDAEDEGASSSREEG